MMKTFPELLLVALSSVYQDLSSHSLLREHLWQQVRNLPTEIRPKVGMVFSAGAVRGLSHIGVLRVLLDAGFPIDVVAGTSMGAVVVTLYVSGMDIERIWEWGLKNRLN